MTNWKVNCGTFIFKFNRKETKTSTWVSRPSITASTLFQELWHSKLVLCLDGNCWWADPGWACNPQELSPRHSHELFVVIVAPSSQSEVRILSGLHFYPTCVALTGLPVPAENILTVWSWQHQMSSGARDEPGFLQTGLVLGIKANDSWFDEGIQSPTWTQDLWSSAPSDQ